MTYKPTKTDFLFAFVLFFAFLFHSVFLFARLSLLDETFYITIPFRLAQGDSLIQHEWHLSQFSSLFSYLPVLVWTKLTGSADGILVFCRAVYLMLHTGIAVTVYRFFRSYGLWAIPAAMMFYLQTPYRIFGISYHSMFALFLLLFALCLLSLYARPRAAVYVCAGLCFGSCCVCNPLLCLLYIPWLLLCLQRHTSPAAPARHFFTPRVLGYTTAGIGILAATAVSFFFATGGSLSSIGQNLEYLFRVSEYDLSFFGKIAAIVRGMLSISFGLPLLSILSAALLLDKNRMRDSHRLAYLSVALLMAPVYLLGILSRSFYTLYFFSLPFFVFSTLCYVLTKNKNKPLFYGMWCPCAVAAVFHALASNTLLSAMGLCCAIGNIAGVFFARDLFRELLPTLRETASGCRWIRTACRRLICGALGFQLIFYAAVLMFGQLPGREDIRLREGPLAGICVSESEYLEYTRYLRDMDAIAQRSSPEDPVLIYSSKNWLYLYLDRPFAIYSTWFEREFLNENHRSYYRENPEKTPRYIYLDNAVCSQWDLPKYLSTADAWFSCTVEELSAGLLLTMPAYPPG